MARRYEHQQSHRESSLPFTRPPPTSSWPTCCCCSYGLASWTYLHQAPSHDRCLGAEAHPGAETAPRSAVNGGRDRGPPPCDDALKRGDGICNNVHRVEGDVVLIKSLGASGSRGSINFDQAVAICRKNEYECLRAARGVNVMHHVHGGWDQPPVVEFVDTQTQELRPLGANMPLYRDLIDLFVLVDTILYQTPTTIDSGWSELSATTSSTTARPPKLNESLINRSPRRTALTVAMCKDASFRPRDR